MTYNNHADLGGRGGFGPVQPEPENERFHAAWEPRALALTLAMGATGAWNIDQSRSARETLPQYAHLSYYQIWLAALEKLLAERGLVVGDELAAALPDDSLADLPAARALSPARPLARRLAAADVPAALAKGSSTWREPSAAPRFAPGDRVRSSAQVPNHHSRLPAYARAKLGRVAHGHGAHVFADAHAQGLGECPQHLYTVVFDGSALWGADAAPGLSVSIDIWESLLEPA